MCQKSPKICVKRALRYVLKEHPEVCVKRAQKYVCEGDIGFF